MRSLRCLWSRKRDTIPSQVRRAISLFNRRDFLAAHELLEQAWHDASGDARQLYETIIRVAAALHMRLNRGARTGSVNLLQQALVRLEDLRPSCAEIDTAAFYESVAVYLERLRAKREPARWDERLRLPKIRRTKRRSMP